MSEKQVQFTDLDGKPAIISYANAPRSYLVDPRREAFCRLLAGGDKTARECFCEAFGKEEQPGNETYTRSLGSMAARLASETGIILRVQELQRPVIKRLRRKLEYSVQKGLEECQEAYDLALALGNVNAMMKAIEMKAKLAKLLSEDINVNHRYGVLDNASTEVLLEMKREMEVRRERRKKLLESGATEIKLIEATPQRPPSVEAGRVP